MRRREKSLIIIIIFLKPIHINASKRSLSSNERNDIVIIILRVNNSALEFPFATKETGEIVFNSIHVDPPINTSRTTKDLRFGGKNNTREDYRDRRAIVAIGSCRLD